MKQIDYSQTGPSSLQGFQQGFNISRGIQNAPYETQKLKAGAQDAELTASVNKLSAIGNLLNGVKDQDSYTMARNTLAQAGIINPQDVPDVYDPAYVEMHKNSLLNAKAQFEKEKFAFDKRGGVQGALVDRMSDPTFRDNLLGKANASKGVVINPTTGQAETVSGYNEAVAGTKGAEKGAEKTSEMNASQIGDATKTFDIMHSNLPSVLERFKEMRDASNNASSGFGANEEGTGLAQQFAKSSIGNDITSNANALLKQRAAQGILPELGPQLAQAGVRGNKFLETLANSASGLDLAAKPKDKISLINGLENTYINNLKATAAQLREKGQNAPSDKDIDAIIAQVKGGTVPANMPTPIQNSKESFGEVPENQIPPIVKANMTPSNIAVQPKTPKIGTIEDGHVFLGGDPSNPKNWKVQR